MALSSVRLCSAASTAFISVQLRAPYIGPNSAPCFQMWAPAVQASCWAARDFSAGRLMHAVTVTTLGVRSSDVTRALGATQEDLQ